MLNAYDVLMLLQLQVPCQFLLQSHTGFLFIDARLAVMHVVSAWPLVEFEDADDSKLLSYFFLVWLELGQQILVIFLARFLGLAGNTTH